MVNVTAKLERYIEKMINDVRDEQKQIVSTAEKRLLQQGRETRASLEQRQEQLEVAMDRNAAKTNEFADIVSEMKELFDRDYKEFVRDRKRWKSDFDRASTKAVNNFNNIENLLNNCLTQNKTNTQVLKQMLDAMMIAQLCYR